VATEMNLTRQMTILTLWKMRTIFDMLSDKYYSPTEHLAVNEIIVLYKGQVIFKQYIPKKHSLEYKSKGFVSLKGYTYDIRVYKGKRQ
jgi:hypothetical protein